MKLTSLTLPDLKKIQNLLVRKNKLNKQLMAIDRLLEHFEGGPPPAPEMAAPRRKAARRGPRGQLKIKIIDTLKAAGNAGLHIKEVAAKVKNKDNNVRTWFLTTGKKIKNIKKAGPAKYRWQD